MKRDPDALADSFDAVIAGGGVHGLALARTLARSGVRVALLERGDFGGATTHNSLKIVHGGLRYVQHLDAVRIWESVRSQRAWIAAAPHLVRPMRFTMPTHGWGIRGPIALAGGMGLYSLLAGNRNRGLPQASKLPGVSLSSGASFRRRFPEVRAQDVNGAASWFDAQIRDSSRVVIECLHDAVASGAVMLNHIEVIGLLKSARRVEGVRARDLLSGREFEVRATATVAALGPWCAQFLQRFADGPSAVKDLPWTRNVNIVLRQRIVAHGAVGLMSRQPADGLIGKASRLYFVTPWQDTSIIGTAHELFQSGPDELAVSEVTLRGLLQDISSVLEGRQLGLDDVAYVHMGLTPSEEAGKARAKRTIIADERDHGLPGYIEIAANKYTSAPEVSRAVTARVMAQLGRANAPVARFDTPLPLATNTADPVQRLENAATPEQRETAWVQAIYGRRASEILSIAQDQPNHDVAARLFRARVMFGVREEMAVRLSDAVFRCGDLAERGRLRPVDLQWCADWMARYWGWSVTRRSSEIDNVVQRLRRHMSGGPTADWTVPPRGVWLDDVEAGQEESGCRETICKQS